MTAEEKEDAKNKNTEAMRKARASMSAVEKEMVRAKGAEARRKARASKNAKEKGEAAAKDTRKTPKEVDKMGHRAKAKVKQHQKKTKHNWEKPVQGSMTPEQGKQNESAQEHTAQTMLEGFAEFLHRRNLSFVLQQHPFAA